VTSATTGERLQKVLANAGVASRRQAETMITAGRVTVNGRIVTELGTRVQSSHDVILIDGRRIEAQSLAYYVIHKPRGVVTTLSDPEGRPALGEYTSKLNVRVYPVGRLDFHTSGALLLTNDGALAQALLHPRFDVPKTYVAKVRGTPTPTQLDAIRRGVQLEAVGRERADVPTRPAEVQVLRKAALEDDRETRREPDDRANTWLEIVLREGRNRQIHRMAEAVGLFVMRLARLSFAGITTVGLRPGEMRPLTPPEIDRLRRTYAAPAGTATRLTTAGKRRKAPIP